MIDWLKYKKIYFLVSFIAIVVGVYSLFRWGLNLSVDFTGGTIIEYQTVEGFSVEKAEKLLDGSEFELNSVQTTDDGTVIFRLQPIDEENRDKVASIAAEAVTLDDIENATNSSKIALNELRYETVGPTIGPELVRKTVYAILVSAGIILLWVAYQFKDLRYGVSAIFAMLHDSFILIASFSLLGHFFDAEIDFLFVTALLTTLSFSVHDTIVVFDRIRELGGNDIDDIVAVSNKALTETMVRSLNNSFTIIFMLVALLLMGGVTIKWFAAALLIGTVLGTYSSPFVAVPLLVTWDSAIGKIKKLFKK
ncbi:protein translocase subunit SecF [Candidatus Woesebacteria bacterium]|nr:protein translocase subunit SecF [Candidatus Woesebacteria bacterium]